MIIYYNNIFIGNLRNKLITNLLYNSSVKFSWHKINGYIQPCYCPICCTNRQLNSLSTKLVVMFSHVTVQYVVQIIMFTNWSPALQFTASFCYLKHIYVSLKIVNVFKNILLYTSEVYLILFTMNWILSTTFALKLIYFHYNNENKSI